MLLLSAGVAGQGVVEAEARRSHLGRVLGPGGDPVSGASVTFLSGGDGLGSDADAVRVVARDNGRFRAELLRGRHYRAYAVAPAGSLLEAAPVVSALSELGVPVTELRFSADQVAAPAETFEIHGLQAVLLEISQSFHGRYFSGFASDRDGRLVLSFLPSESRTVSFKLRSDTFGGPTLESSRLWLAETEESEEVVLYEKKE